MTMSINLVLVFIEFVYFVQSTNAYEVVHAINAGGGAFTDTNDIYYEADPLNGKVGTASGLGKQLTIGRVSEEDEILYQTERYHTDSFAYDIPLAGDGEYALVLKFSEVYFNVANSKMFDVVLNSAHTVVDKLDIFKAVGKGVAYDEIVYFTISRGVLHYGKQESRVRGDRVRVEFVKSSYDNPKINAIVLFKGSDKIDLDHIPQLQPIDEYFDNVLKDNVQDTYESDDEPIRNIREEPKEETAKIRKTSGPKQQNPYQLDDSTTMLPIFIAIGAFVPLLYCLCKL